VERTTDSTGDAGSVPPQKATATQHRSGHERSFNHFAGIPHGGRTDRRVIDGQETWESRLSLSNHPPRAKPLAEALRRHWSIENSQHWVLDVAFGEDVRRCAGPATFALHTCY